MDRIDIHVEVPAVAYKDLAGGSGTETSAAVRGRVLSARKVQSTRFDGSRVHANAQMGSRHLKKFCRIDDGCAALLESAVDRLGLSARAYSRILKIARTVADLAGKADNCADHIAEAIQYRFLDRNRSAAGRPAHDR